MMWCRGCYRDHKIDGFPNTDKRQFGIGDRRQKCGMSVKEWEITL